MPTNCKHCGHDPSSPFTASVVADRPERPVSAVCVLTGCQYAVLAVDRDLDPLRAQVEALRLSDAGTERGAARQYGWNGALAEVVKLIDAIGA